MRLTVMQVAEICHNANRSFSLLLGEDSPSWEDAPDIIRMSAAAGVRTHMKHPYLTPQQSHDSWCDYKRHEGWIWGPKKDTEKREHPLLIPYNQLPDHQKVKDWLFKGIVNAFMAEGQIRDPDEV